MENKKCIICFENKKHELFNEEHIIPAALGGSFIINNVCIECNSNLGNTIDSKLLKNTVILHYRNVFNLTRQPSGSVPNPFKGVHLDSNNNAYLAGYKNGKLFTQAVERFEISDKSESIGTLTLPIEKFDEADEIIKKHFKRNGISADSYRVISLEKNEPTDTIEVKALADHNSFIFGCIKIAYETVTLLFPNSVSDPEINNLRLFLKTGVMTDSLLNILKEGSSLHTLYSNKLSTIEHLSANHHLIITEYLDKIGLVCTVKLFDVIYSVILSKIFQPINTGQEIIFFNDCLSSIHGTNINYNVISTSFHIEKDILLANIKGHTIETITEESFKYENKTPVFNQFGKILFEDINDLSNNYLKNSNSSFMWSDTEIKFDLNPNHFYIKLFSSQLLPLISITVKRNIVLQKITN